MAFAGTSANGQDAPIPAVRRRLIEPPESALSGHTWQAIDGRRTQSSRGQASVCRRPHSGKL